MCEAKTIRCILQRNAGEARTPCSSGGDLCSGFPSLEELTVNCRRDDRETMTSEVGTTCPSCTGEDRRQGQQGAVARWDSGVQEAEKVVGGQAHADASGTLGVCPIQAAAQSCHQLTPGSGPPLVPSACQDFDFPRLFPFTDFRHLASYEVKYERFIEAFRPNQLKDVFLYVAPFPKCFQNTVEGHYRSQRYICSLASVFHK